VRGKAAAVKHVAPSAMQWVFYSKHAGEYNTGSQGYV
jgi:hypothetical protein